MQQVSAPAMIANRANFYLSVEDVVVDVDAAGVVVEVDVDGVDVEDVLVLAELSPVEFFL